MRRMLIAMKSSSLDTDLDFVEYKVEIYGEAYELLASFIFPDTPQLGLQEPGPELLDVLATHDPEAAEALRTARECEALIYLNGNRIPPTVPATSSTFKH